MSANKWENNCQNMSFCRGPQPFPDIHQGSTGVPRSPRHRFTHDSPEVLHPALGATLQNLTESFSQSCASSTQKPSNISMPCLVKEYITPHLGTALPTIAPRLWFHLSLLHYCPWIACRMVRIVPWPTINASQVLVTQHLMHTGAWNSGN